VIYYSLPIFSSLEAAVFLDEALRAVHVISFALIVGGIIIADRPEERIR
jgi:drug/metabolite transporter (DMT)-like permease